MTSVSMLIVFAFSGKISIWNVLFGLSFENQVQFHKFSALNLLISLIVHISVKGYFGSQGKSGVALMTVLILIFGFSINRMRR